MKRFGTARGYLYVGTLVGLIGFSSLEIHPYGRIQKNDKRAFAESQLKLPSELSPILTRSCMDCHSSNTIWPWYSHLAPISWVIERDVKLGRDRMNFSEWQHYSLAQRSELLADIATAVMNREMPPPQYIFAHKKARLSGMEADAIYLWASHERRKLKADATFTVQEEANKKNILREGISNQAGR